MAHTVLAAVFTVSVASPEQSNDDVHVMSAMAVQHSEVVHGLAAQVVPAPALVPATPLPLSAHVSESQVGGAPQLAMPLVAEKVGVPVIMRTRPLCVSATSAKLPAADSWMETAFGWLNRAVDPIALEKTQPPSAMVQSVAASSQCQSVQTQPVGGAAKQSSTQSAQSAQSGSGGDWNVFP